MAERTAEQVRTRLKNQLIYYDPGFHVSGETPYDVPPEYRQIIGGELGTRQLTPEEAASAAGVSVDQLKRLEPGLDLGSNERSALLQKYVTPAGGTGFFSSLLGGVGGVIGGLTDTVVNPVASALNVHPDAVKAAAALAGLYYGGEGLFFDAATNAVVPEAVATDMIAATLGAEGLAVPATMPISTYTAAELAALDAGLGGAGLPVADVASVVSSAPDLSNVVATLDDGSLLVADTAGNLSVVDDASNIISPDMLPADPQAFAGLQGGALDFVPQQNVFSPEFGQVVSDVPSRFSFGFEAPTGFEGSPYAQDFMGPRLPTQGFPNVVATLDDGAMIVADAAGNLSLVDAADIALDAGADVAGVTSGNTIADVIDAGLVDDVTANTYLDPGRPVDVLDSGAISQTFDDGSSISIDASGNVTVTDATDVITDGVPINREVILDADLPGTQTSGPIDADGVSINREVTLDATPPADARQATGVIDADGVPINREVTVGDLADTGQPTTQVFDDGSTLIDANGNLSATTATDAGTTVVQTFDDGSAIVMDSNGNLSATPAPGGETNPVIGGDTGVLQTFDDGSTLQVFDDGSTLAVDSAGNVSSSQATDTGVIADTGVVRPTQPDGATLQDTAQTQGTVQTFDDGSTLQTFDDGSTIATDADGNVVTSTATDVSPFQIGKPELSLTDKLADAGQSVLDYVTSNPLTTAALLAGAAGLAGGEEQQQQQEPAKKTYTYGEAPGISYAGLPELFRASSTIYGPQETYTPPAPKVQQLPKVEMGPLLSGQAPGAGLRSLIKTLPNPIGMDINQLTPEQLAQFERAVAQGGV